MTAEPLYEQRPWWQVAAELPPVQLALETKPEPAAPELSDQKRGLVTRGFCPGCGDEIVEFQGLGIVLGIRECEPAPGLVAFDGLESTWRLLGEELALRNWEIVLREHSCG